MKQALTALTPYLSDAQANELADSAAPVLTPEMSLVKEVLDRVSREIGGGKVLDVGGRAQGFRKEFQARHFRYSSFSDLVEPAPDFSGNLDETLPVALKFKSPFDLLVCHDSLKKVADWNKAFANLSLLVRDQGYLFVTTPFLATGKEEASDLWRPTPRAILHFANLHDFELVEQVRLGGPLEALAEVVTAAQSHLGPVMTKGWISRLLARVSRRCARLFLWGVLRVIRSGRFDEHFLPSDLLFEKTIFLFKKRKLG